MSQPRTSTLRYVSNQPQGPSWLRILTATQDPFFEEVKTTDRKGNQKIKKQKKGVPAGISQHDGNVLMAVRRRAYRLDLSLFNLCGIRFGWSAIIGIIPG